MAAVTPTTRLHYASGRGGHSGTNRRLHVDPECAGLKHTPCVTECSLDSRPRGLLCSLCTPQDLDMDSLPEGLEVATNESYDREKKFTCPKCHEEWANLPVHMRACSGTDGGEA
ncbi:hypothetical protein [Haloarchaeobius sp. HRN-SO-5]|uniref:hypothetical protein n=1 Tax=Haloarchaeobius sp. HRN-SO-5 TaxID=3446118 RepID=UPI003EBC9E02